MLFITDDGQGLDQKTFDMMNSKKNHQHKKSPLWPSEHKTAPERDWWQHKIFF